MGYFLEWQVGFCSSGLHGLALRDPEMAPLQKPTRDGMWTRCHGGSLQATVRRYESSEELNGRWKRNCVTPGRSSNNFDLRCLIDRWRCSYKRGNSRKCRRITWGMDLTTSRLASSYEGNSSLRFAKLFFLSLLFRYNRALNIPLGGFSLNPLI